MRRISNRDVDVLSVYVLDCGCICSNMWSGQLAITVSPSISNILDLLQRGHRNIRLSPELASVHACAYTGMRVPLLRQMNWISTHPHALNQVWITTYWKPRSSDERDNISFGTHRIERGESLMIPTTSTLHKHVGKSLWFTRHDLQ